MAATSSAAKQSKPRFYLSTAASPTLSQVAFESIINPALKTQYEAVGGTFVDVTSCQLGDIHARASGYGVIARLIARTLPERG